MKISFYNTIKRKKQSFSPIDKNKIKLYTCGPTVYDFAHIGNFRAYLFEDLLRRTLEYFNFNVLHIMNITDIDDKTIKSSIKENKSLTDFTSYYTDSFLEDVSHLNILPAHHYPRATNFISQMIDMIKKLEEKGFTYTTDDNSVFFRISSFSDYGKLANLDPESLKSGERVEEDEYDKEEGRDFALWKGYKKEDGDVYWDSPWGKGRPGWHIECSAMSMHYLGNHFDIHCGGVDNIFPHHENEIAQSCCFSGADFVNYWLHNEHLIVEGQKMSKSLGNFYTIRDLIKKGYKAESIRYALISSHYRQKLNFTFERLENAKKSINKLRELSRRLLAMEDDSISDNKEYSNKTKVFLDEYNKCLADDLNISGALGALFIWVNWLFKSLDDFALSRMQCEDANERLSKVDCILAVINIRQNIDKDVEKLISQREDARKNKDWKKSDEIRELLLEKGIILEDTPTGTIWKFK